MPFSIDDGYKYDENSQTGVKAPLNIVTAIGGDDFCYLSGTSIFYYTYHQSHWCRARLSETDERTLTWQSLNDRKQVSYFFNSQRSLADLSEEKSEQISEALQNANKIPKPSEHKTQSTSSALYEGSLSKSQQGLLKGLLSYALKKSENISDDDWSKILTATF